MKTLKVYEFLIKEYHFKYAVNKFSSFLGFEGPFYAYSFFNSHGCFTILHAFQRNEFEYYVSTMYSDKKEILLAKNISQTVFDLLIQKRKNPKNWFRSENLLISQIIKQEINEKGKFWDIKVD